MKKQIVKFCVMLLLSVLMIGCGDSSAEEIDWVNIRLGDVLPEPKSKEMKIWTNSDENLSVDICNTSQNDYYEYTRLCEDNGFSIDVEYIGDSFYGFNEEGYYLGLSYYDSNKEMHISLDEPIEFGEYTWPDFAVELGLSQPVSAKGAYNWEDTDRFSLNVGATSFEEYSAYVDVCKSAGFIIDSSKGEKSFYGDNEQGYHINVSYKGYNTMVIWLEAPKETNIEGDAENSESVLDDMTNTPDISQSSDGTIDYMDAESFENAINNKTKVKGKVVQFYVLEYAPNSLLGINCHAGEHLNFLFETEPDVSAGDTVIVRVSEEPTQIFLLESWKVPCEFLEISKKADKTEIDNSNDTEGDEKEDIVSDTEPDKPRPVFYSTNDRETAKKGNTGVFSYKSKGGSYDVYWIIDFDEGYVYNFTEGNGETSCDRVAIAEGDLNDRITVTWHDGGEEWSWYLHFKYKNAPETLVLNDHNGFSVEFKTTDLDDALELRNSKTIYEY